MSTPTDSDSQNYPDASGGSDDGLCSALHDALALVDFGACRDGNPAEWIKVSGPMCAHCIGSEDVNLAAARIIAAHYRKFRTALEFERDELIRRTAGSTHWEGCALDHPLCASLKRIATMLSLPNAELSA